MNLSIRNKYFVWLIVLMLAIYLLMAGVLTGIEFHESIVRDTQFSKDIPEILAFVGVMLVTLPVAILIAWFVAGRLLRPLAAVESTMAQIRQGNLDERVPLPEDKELARLAAAINEAFDRYAMAARRLEQFSADASHQLRTPMAAIRTSAEVALQQPRDQADYEESLSDILEQTERLNQTVDQLLLLARMDASVRRDFVPVVLADLIRGWTSEAQAMFESRSITCAIDPPCYSWAMPGNAILLRQCFDNLINNAVAVTPEGGAIMVRLEKSAGYVQWITEDNGPGIPMAERSLIYDRFYRGKTAKEKGSGLGLAIVKEIVTLHGGKVRVADSTSLGGAAMIVEFIGPPT